MTSLPPTPFLKINLKDLPEDFCRLLEDAASLAKRLGRNLVGFPHLLHAILQRYPGAVFADPTKPDPTLAPHLLAQAEQPAYLLDGTELRVSGDMVDILNHTRLMNFCSDQEFLRMFLEAARERQAHTFHRLVPRGLPILPAAGSNAGTAGSPAPGQDPKAAGGQSARPSLASAGLRGGENPASGSKAQTNAGGRPETNGQATGGRVFAGIQGGISDGSGGLTTVLGEFFLDSLPPEFPGREDDLLRLASALSRRDFPAVMLVAPPGTGKTALILHLAGQVVRGAIPALKGFSVVALNPQAILAGATKGAINQDALTQTLSRLADQPKTLVLCDDLHVFLEIGGPLMAHDMAACFRSFLLAGRLRILFAVHPGPFQRIFAIEPVFSSNVLPIFLEELNGEALARTARLASQDLAAFHGTRLSPPSIDSAVKLGSESRSNLRPPGSVIRLLDLACTRARQMGRIEVTPEDVAESTFAQKDGFVSRERERLRTLEEDLARQVVGQEEAIKAVAQRVRLTKLQLDRKPQRPDGVFLFLGPSGVGKTELAKALALSLYGDFSHFVRLDMSEFIEQHEYSKMIGAPPGYIGHGEEGHLTGPIARLGHAVLLLDEVEKAHSSVLRLLLQVFDEGFLTDGKGRRVDFSRCVVIMTSNLGKELYSQESNPLGFVAATPPSSPGAQGVLNYLLKRLPSEFVNRIDVLVPFLPLTMDNLESIARRQLKDEADRWAKRGKQVSFDDLLPGFLARMQFEPRLGARHLNRNLEKAVCQPLSEAACSEAWARVRQVKVKLAGDLVRLDLDGKPWP